MIFGSSLRLHFSQGTEVPATKQYRNFYKEVTFLKLQQEQQGMSVSVSCVYGIKISDARCVKDGNRLAGQRLRRTTIMSCRQPCC